LDQSAATDEGTVTQSKFSTVFNGWLENRPSPEIAGLDLETEMAPRQKKYAKLREPGVYNIAKFPFRIERKLTPLYLNVKTFEKIRRKRKGR